MAEPARIFTYEQALGTFPTVRDVTTDAVQQVQALYSRVQSPTELESFKIAKYMAPYTVTKAAVESLVQCAALELAPFRIRVNCIRPGFVPTEGTALAFDDEGAEELVAITPLGRSGRAEEIGDAVAYFSAESGAWVTGQVLAVDGGMVLPEGVSFEKLCRKIYGDEVMDGAMGPRAPE